MTRRELSHSDTGEAAERSRLLLTVREAMAELSVSRWTIYNLIRSGELESVTIGRCRRIPRSALEAFVSYRLGAEVSS